MSTWLRTEKAQTVAVVGCHLLYWTAPEGKIPHKCFDNGSQKKKVSEISIITFVKHHFPVTTPNIL